MNFLRYFIITLYTISFSIEPQKKIGHELIIFFPAATLILQFSNFKAPVNPTFLGYYNTI
jgi:hypothetical protein